MRRSLVMSSIGRPGALNPSRSIDSTVSPHMPFRHLAAAFFASLATLAGAVNHELAVTAVAAGPLPVACTNVEQDANLIASFGGTPPEDFWEGKPSNGQLRYISQILRAPNTAIRYDVQVPDNTRLYPQFHGQRVEHVAIVCHPTPAENFDPGYVLHALAVELRVKPRVVRHLHVV